MDRIARYRYLCGLPNPSEADEREFNQLHTSLMRDLDNGSQVTESGTPFTRPRSRDKGIALRSDETMAQWGVRSGHLSDTEHDYNFGKIVRGLATGDWTNAEQEMRAISENPTTAGGHLLPAPVVYDVIQNARNASSVLRAGATVVPMQNSTLKYPRVASEPSPNWRDENEQIDDAAITFDSVTLTARSLALLVKCSWELLDDAAPQSRVIEDVFANAFAQEIDRVALRGSGTPPEPRGVKNYAGITETDFGTGADGETPDDYSVLLDAVQALRAQNFEPTAAIMNPRTERTFAGLREGGTTGAYLAPPAGLVVPRLLTNQIPVDNITGSNEDTSEIFVADWSKLLLGVRTSLRLRVLEERFADYGQVAFLADWRGDVALTQEGAFVVVSGVRP